MLFRRCRNVSVLLLMLLCGVAAAEYPTPSPYPIAWELQFTHGQPKRIVVDVPITTVAPQAFWYMTYRVTNNTDKEQSFLPRFELLGDNGKLFLANRTSPARLRYDQKQRAQRHAGADHVDHRADSHRPGRDARRRGHLARADGSHGAFFNFRHRPVRRSGHAEKGGREFSKARRRRRSEHVKDLIILRKTLQLNYFIRGDEVYPGEDEVNVDNESWIMR